MRSLVLLALAALLLLPSAAGAAITYDGVNIPSEFTGLLNATQVNPTGFGDTLGVDYGSELDQLYVARGANGLYIGVTGNLETNGNAYIVLIDTVPGGSNVLSATNGPGSVTGLNGTTLDPSFTPEVALAVNNWGGTTYANLVNLVANTDRYLGHTQMNLAGPLEGGDNSNGTLVAFCNTNIAGVTGSATKTATENETDAATASSGLETYLSFADLGITDPSTLSTVRVMVMLGNGGGYISNQTLPGLGSNQTDLGQGGSNLNLSGRVIPPAIDASGPAVDELRIDGAATPVDFNGHLICTQNNYTSWGDRSGEEGSELDQLFIGQDTNGLQVGITGNLRSSGDFWILFLETGPGGYHVLQVPEGVGPQSGVLQGMRGTIFNTGFAPTHAICVNLWGGTAYVDLVDLRTGTGRYLGHSPVNGNSGELVEGDNPNGLIFAFNNTNRAGINATFATDAATATSGAEIRIPFADIGLACCSVKSLVLLTDNKGMVSNQALPPLWEDAENFTVPPADLGLWGNGLAVVPVTGFTFAPVTTVQAARNLANSAPVLLQNVKVSASFPSEGRFYVQDAHSAAGIAVFDQTTVPVEGSVVTVRGYMTVAFGQRAVNACETTINQLPGPGTEHSAPLGMRTTAVGGSALGDNPGIGGANGPTNLGALVKIWGNVTEVDPNGQFFYVDDGAGVLDGTMQPDGVTPYVGVRVLSTKAVTKSSFVAATGLATVFTTYDPLTFAPTNHKAVRVRTDDDVQVLK